MKSAKKPNNNEEIEIASSETPEGVSWQNPGEFPEFAGKQQKTNVDRLQALLNRVGFSELKKDDKEFKSFIETTDKQDMHRYLSHINQKLREVSSKERGFHDGRMVVAELISPNRETQTRVLDYEIDALAQMDNPRYRATSAYYIINDLHMFPDGNGRTARAVFELLDSPEANISEQQQFFSHENNRDQLGAAEHGAYEFQETKNIIRTQDFNQFAMLGYLEKISSDNEGNDIISELRGSLEARIKENGGNIFRVYGGLQNYSPGDTAIPALKNNEGFSSLNEEDKDRVCCALRDGLSRVSVSGLAMLKFYQEKGQQKEFLERTKKKNSDFDYDTWTINIDPDPEEKEFFGHCECEDWSKEDFLHYAGLAESIKEQVLKTSIDIFVNPDDYKFSDKNIAEVATNAQEFYKEKESNKR